MSVDINKTPIISEDDEIKTIVGVVRTNDETARFDAQERTVGAYGYFSIDIYGDWTYILDHSKPSTLALSEGDRVRDTFPIRVENAYGKVISTFVVIYVLGRDDKSEPEVPVFTIEDDMTRGVVTEDEVLMAIGKLCTNIDNARFEIQTGTKGVYGKFGITKDGYWEYNLNNDSEVVQVLNDDDKKIETFPVSAISPDNAVAVSEVKITIFGKDEEIPLEDKSFKIICRCS